MYENRPNGLKKNAIFSGWIWNLWAYVEFRQFSTFSSFCVVCRCRLGPLTTQHHYHCLRCIFPRGNWMGGERGGHTHTHIFMCPFFLLSSAYKRFVCLVKQPHSKRTKTHAHAGKKKRNGYSMTIMLISNRKSFEYDKFSILLGAIKKNGSSDHILMPNTLDGMRPLLPFFFFFFFFSCSTPGRFVTDKRWNTSPLSPDIDVYVYQSAHKRRKDVCFYYHVYMVCSCVCVFFCLLFAYSLPVSVSISSAIASHSIIFPSSNWKCSKERRQTSRKKVV